MAGLTAFAKATASLAEALRAEVEAPPLPLRCALKGASSSAHTLNGDQARRRKAVRQVRQVRWMRRRPVAIAVFGIDGAASGASISLGV